MSNPSGVTQDGDLPVACTLQANDGPARLRRWQRLHQIADPTVQLIDGQLEVRYQSGPDVLAELRDLVDEERVCCASVSWVVSEESGHPILRVTAPSGTPRAVEPIAAMFMDTERDPTAHEA
ncbi:MAG: hypothetical protein M3Y49_16030 [Actinomycetota bacterium]|nr:hypothetical protein [Actinomycetota bacterium]